MTAADPPATDAPSLVVTHDRLPVEVVREVLDLVEEAARVDGTAPVSEHVLLQLRHGVASAARSIFAYLSDRGTPVGVAPPDTAVAPSGPGQPRLVGYAHLDLADPQGWPTAELVVHPRFRRHGIGAALVAALEAASPDGRLQLWAHGRHADATALSRSRGYAEERVLWQLRRSLAEPVPDLPLPAGVQVRAFVPGQDEQAWVEVNNRAFADHPEQGRWTVGDLLLREAEPWFDAAGFLLAERTSDRALVGFHWTKVHGSLARDGAAVPEPEPIGEVYVLGVDPSAQGIGLGPALTTAGLRYLRGLGLTQVMLYVDDTNRSAVRLYERLGFTRWKVDVRYRRNRS